MIRTGPSVLGCTEAASQPFSMKAPPLSRPEKVSQIFELRLDLGKIDKTVHTAAQAALLHLVPRTKTFNIKY
jgi:hypothetical protein